MPERMLSHATPSPRPDWIQSKLPTTLRIGLTTFAILMLELTIIRWSSSQLRIFAYFNNLVLIGSFLGMGLGVALGRRRPELFSLTLPLLLLLSLGLGLSDQLNIATMSFPDRSIALWGGEHVKGDLWVFAHHMGIVLVLFSLIVACFACAAIPLGHLFSHMQVLKAYSSDLLGSLLGVLCFSALAFLSTGPVWWMLLSLIPLVLLQRRQLLQLLCAGLVVLLTYHSQQGIVFSPYNRIELKTSNPLYLELGVNRDFHQFLHDLSDKRLEKDSLSPEDKLQLNHFRRLYDLPFVINANRGTALVVGAGTGNDVQAALRHGYRSIDSVDIDGTIIELGRKLHPEKPYANPATRPIVEDARAFFEQNKDKRYDVVCYGLLDSHSMSSAMSTLRLDNFVYTEDGIRSAWRLVGPKGHLSLAISCISGWWFTDRVYWTVAKATGQRPIAVYAPIHDSVTFIVARDPAQLSKDAFETWPRILPSAPMEAVITPTDDWPFLYTRPGVFPWGYAIIIGFTLLLAAVSTRGVFGIGEGGSVFHWPLFLMGAAFMLIEARGVTSMSLLFGSTWAVNAAIFSGILVMVLLANLLVMRLQIKDPMPWFLGLFMATLLLWIVPVGELNSFPLALRGLLGGLLTGLPVGFAGIIVPVLLSRSKDAPSALGSNLLGSVLGGCLEYYSMMGGMRATALLALTLYLLAFLLVRRQAASAAVQVQA